MQPLKDRTKQFAVAVIRFCSSLPPKDEYGVIGRQLMRSASSVGANYRAACRARSRRDFIAKLSIVEEEADESAYWLEVIQALGDDQVDAAQRARLHQEAEELLAITVASKKTARRNA
ncbi:MAG: four helix bundle protein [Bacteroidota bacterium]